MAENSKIEWTTHTASPWYGCTKIAAGCEHCYAATMSKRNPSTLGVWGDDGTRVKSKSFLDNLRRWNKSAAKRGVIESVFPSMCDPFEDRPELKPWRQEMFDAIDECQNLRLLLLTKRPENVRRMWPPVVHQSENWFFDPEEQKRRGLDKAGPHKSTLTIGNGNRKNVWLLTSVSTQDDADRNVPELLKCRDLCRVLGVSAEPLVGPVSLERLTLTDRTHANALLGAKYYTYSLMGSELIGDFPKLDWVIVGSESGPGARPCDVAWIRSIIHQCGEADVPCFVKQLGAHVIDRDSTAACSFPDSECWPAGFKQDGQRIILRDKKGGDPAEWPEDLRVRQFPS